MSLIEDHLKAQRTRYIRQTALRFGTQACAVLAGFWFIVGLLALLTPRATTLWFSIWIAGSLALFSWVIYRAITQIWRMRTPHQMAAFIEQRDRSLGFQLRNTLDFQSQLQTAPSLDETSAKLETEYIHRVETHLHRVQPVVLDPHPWARIFLATVGLLAILLFFRGEKLSLIFSGSLPVHANETLFLEGSVAIFEPEYTGIPGRTLPIEKPRFEAYPGSRIRFHFENLNPRKTYQIEVTQGEERAVNALTPGEVGRFEWLLLAETSFQLQLADDPSSHSRTLQFITREDRGPQIDLRGHTEEGEINPRNPIMIEADLSDDFGIQKLEWVIQWDTPWEQKAPAEPNQNEGASSPTGERRLEIHVPPAQATRFIARNQWNVSDLVPEGTETFQIHLEAVDNNPINGPGVGMSNTLHFGVQTPEKARREFMAQVRELLNVLTHGLADNLITPWSNPRDRATLVRARNLNNSIRTGLMQARDITAGIEAQLRTSSELGGMDREFFRNLRLRVSQALNIRMDVGQVFAQLQFTEQIQQNDFNRIRRYHQNEELGLEDIIYDLVLQMKLWALMEMEESQENVEETLSELEELLQNSEDMETDDLKKQVDKLLNELMQQLANMFQQAAQEMDMTMQEFMNMEAMEQNQEELSDLKSQLEEALKEGDMEKAKQILEALKQTMEAMMNSMKQSMGEMSPEMMEMMEAMREMMGLVQALKEGEEQLQADTQRLRQEMDKQIEDQMPAVSEEMKQSLQEIIERILAILDGMNRELTAKDLDTWMKPLLDRMAELSLKGQENPIGAEERRELRQLRQSIRFLTSNGMDRILELILNSVEDTKELGEFLDQESFYEALRQAQMLRTSFFRGKTSAKADLPPSMNEEVGLERGFAQAEEELMKIIEFLENLQDMRDQLRQMALQKQAKGQSQELSERQDQLEQMIPEFFEKYGKALERMPMMDMLKSVQQDMGRAEDRLAQNSLNQGLRYEQEALRKLGELQEQMQQMQPGQGSPMMPMPMPMMPNQNQMGHRGDPTGDIFIPDAERKARKSHLKDQILKKMQESLPQSHSKDIRKYYERLVDQ